MCDAGRRMWPAAERRRKSSRRPPDLPRRRGWIAPGCPRSHAPARLAACYSCTCTEPWVTIPWLKDGWRFRLGCVLQACDSGTGCTGRGASDARLLIGKTAARRLQNAARQSWSCRTSREGGGKLGCLLQTASARRPAACDWAPQLGYAGWGRGGRVVARSASRPLGRLIAARWAAHGRYVAGHAALPVAGARAAPNAPGCRAAAAGARQLNAPGAQGRPAPPWRASVRVAAAAVRVGAR